MVFLVVFAAEAMNNDVPYYIERPASPDIQSDDEGPPPSSDNDGTASSSEGPPPLVSDTSDSEPDWRSFVPGPPCVLAEVSSARMSLADCRKQHDNQLLQLLKFRT